MKKNYIVLIAFVVIISLFSSVCYAENENLSYEYTKYSGSFRDMAISDNGTIIVVGTNGKIFLVIDNEWNEIEQPIFDKFTEIEYGNGAFYVISENSVYKSRNGIDWECVNSGLGVKDTGVFYYNGESFVFEKENKGTTSSGMAYMKADEVYLTRNFTDFEKVGEAQLENMVGKDIFQNSETTKDIWLSPNDSYQILFGAGIVNTRNIQRRIQLFYDLSDVNFPVPPEDIKYLGKTDDLYEIFYISNYNLIRATTIDFENWHETIIELPEKCDHLYNVNILHNNGYYIKYQTNESYNYDYTKNLVYSPNLIDFTVLANITDEDGNLYVLDELYVLKNTNAYKLKDSQFIKCFEIQNNTEKSTVKYSNGKYIKWVYDNGVSIYLSDDGVIWNKVEAPDIALTARCFNVDGKAYYDVIWDGTNYLIRPTSCDSGYNPTGEKGSLFVCDSSLNLIKEIPFDNYILDMSYENETYNILTNIDNLLYTSNDLENWKSQENDMSITLSNNRTSIVKQLNKAEKGYSITDFQTKAKIKDTFDDIIFENYQDGDIYVSGEHYIKLNNKIILLSDDGVYWHTIQLPSGIDIPKSVYTENNTLYIKTDDVELKYDITNLYNNMHTYVKVSDKILGFDVEPVIESDRTLVPLRFIFETMGADVDWEDATRTATVKNDEATISVSIDDASAKVNHVRKTMDVPARLVNDKTMVPLRFLSEELGFNVEWDEETRTATIRN